MAFSFIKEYGPIAPMTNTIVDPRDLRSDSRKKRLDKTNGKKKVTKDSKTEDEPRQNPGETAVMNPKEETQNEDMRVSTRRKAFTKSGKAIKRKPTNTMPHLTGVAEPRPQYNSKGWDLDEITSLDEASFDEFINTLTNEEFENLKEGILGTIAKMPFKGVKGKFGGLTHNKKGNFRLSTAGRADAAEGKYKKRKQYEKDKARLDKYNAKLANMNAKSFAKATKGALPGHTTGGQKIAAGTEYQGGKTMNEMSKIRRALLDVIEKKQSHGHMDAREKWKEKFKGAGALKMKKDLEDNPKDNPIWNKEKESHDDAEKAGRAGPGKSPARGGADNLKGETKIIPPGTKMKDPGAKKGDTDPNVDKGKPSTNENKVIDNITNAYNSMYEKKLKGDQHKLDHDKDGDIDAADFAGLRKKKKEKKEAMMVKKPMVKMSSMSGGY